MDPMIARISQNLVARVTGPMHFRLLLQPGVATFFAIRDGLKDARESEPPYFWGLFTNKVERKSMVKHGWKSVGKAFILAMASSTWSISSSSTGGPFIRWQRGRRALVAIILAIVPPICCSADLSIESPPVSAK